MSIKLKQDELIEEFSFFDDWTQKYEYIIEMAKELKPMDSKYKTDDFLVKGCQSKVWLRGEIENNKLQLQADSDAIISKGIVALLLRIYNNESPDDIINNEMYFIDEIGLKEHLSPNRSNGLSSMLKKIKTYALAYTSKA
jgi:cysteine desulfuration protein SufE